MSEPVKPRHSGAGRNPVYPTAPREAGQQGLVRFAGFLSLLDSGLRRNDVKGAL